MLWRMQRVAVIGSSGSGKTTLAAALARRLGVPHIELDALYHQPGWVPAAPEGFRAAIDAATAGDGWVVDGNYGAAAESVRPRADVIVALDLPRLVVLRAVLARTLRRGVRREELWNGNREPLASLLRWDPERSIVRWAWTQHPRRRAEIATLVADAGTGPPAVVVLRSRREMAAWLAAGGAIVPE